MESLKTLIKSLEQAREGDDAFPYREQQLKDALAADGKVHEWRYIPGAGYRIVVRYQSVEEMGG